MKKIILMLMMFSHASFSFAGDKPVYTTFWGTTFEVGDQVLSQCGWSYYAGRIEDITSSGKVKIRYNSILVGCDGYDSSPDLEHYSHANSYTNFWGTTFKVGDKVLSQCGWNSYGATIKDLTASGKVRVRYSSDLVVGCDGYESISTVEQY